MKPQPKKLINTAVGTLCIAVALSLTFALFLATKVASAKNDSSSKTKSSPKPSDVMVASKKMLPSKKQFSTTANPEILTAPPGYDTVTPDQIQQAAADVKAGQEALANGRLNEAETYFRQATRLPELDASHVDALVGLAQTLEQEGKGQQAIKVYRYLLYPKKGWGTSLEQDPILRMHFTLLLASDQQWPEAVSVYESVINTVQIGPAYPRLDIQFSPNTPEPALLQAMAHLALGVAYNGRGEHAKALPEYDAALSIQPNLAIAHYYHGYGLQRLGRRDEAQADFAKAAALGEGDVKKAAQSPDGLLLK